MPANYSIALGDAQQEVKSGGDIDKEFTFVIPPSAQRQLPFILQLMVQTLGANDLRVGVSINGSQIFNYGPSDTNLTRPFHDVVSAQVLNVGNNKLKVALLSGKGTFRFSNIVVWFQDNTQNS